MFLLPVLLLVAVQLGLVAAQVLPFLLTGFLDRYLLLQLKGFLLLTPSPSALPQTKALKSIAEEQ